LCESGDSQEQTGTNFSAKMKSINQVALSGTLNCDASDRATPTGSTVSNCTLAVVEEFAKRGEPSKLFTSYVPLVAFGMSAEALADGRKGDRVIISGSLATETAGGKDGAAKTFKTVVKVSGIVFLDPVNDADQGHPGPPPSQPAPAGRPPTAREIAQKAAQDDLADQEVPF
jgi:single-stranded DNA-binding protein